MKNKYVQINSVKEFMGITFFIKNIKKITKKLIRECELKVDNKTNLEFLN